MIYLFITKGSGIDKYEIEADSVEEAIKKYEKKEPVD